ncbi:MAG: hypothetical protein M3N17_00860 [Actinomycetota bacterium]|nr:hypothetical protein [Actinomycetota bacterium]
MIVLQSSVSSAFSEGLARVSAFVPTFLSFLLILVIGYFVARVLARAINAVLERLGFDRAVERGGVKQALDRSNYDASDVLSKLVFYTILLFVLQLAFGVFGDNPISDLLFAVIAFLPKVFVAIVIIVVASAIAAAVKEIVEASLGGLSYGRVLAGVASAAILFVGVFAALNQLEIAPAIINALFYTLLAIVAGSAIIAIGGSGIAPLRAQWEKAISRVEEEAPKLQQEASGATEDVKQRARERRQQAQGGGDSQGPQTTGAVRQSSS